MSLQILITIKEDGQTTITTSQPLTPFALLSMLNSAIGQGLQQMATAESATLADTPAPPRLFVPGANRHERRAAALRRDS